MKVIDKTSKNAVKTLTKTIKKAFNTLKQPLLALMLLKLALVDLKSLIDL